MPSRLLSVAMIPPQEEVRMPLQSGEGPICLIMGPSRELVRQIHEVVQACANTLANDTNTRYPEIRVALVTGAHVCTVGKLVAMTVCSVQLESFVSLTSVIWAPGICRS